MKLTTKILLGLVVGAAVGVTVQASGSEGARSAVLAFEPLGTAFIRLISMVVVPLVVASLFVGTCSVGDVRRLARSTSGKFDTTTGIRKTSVRATAVTASDRQPE